MTSSLSSPTASASSSSCCSERPDRMVWSTSTRFGASRPSSFRRCAVQASTTWAACTSPDKASGQYAACSVSRRSFSSSISSAASSWYFSRTSSSPFWTCRYATAGLTPMRAAICAYVSPSRRRANACSRRWAARTRSGDALLCPIARCSLVECRFAPRGILPLPLSPQGANGPEGGELGHLGHLARNTGNSPVFDAGEPQAAKLSELGPLGTLGPDEGGPAAAYPKGEWRDDDVIET